MGCMSIGVEHPPPNNIQEAQDLSIGAFSACSFHIGALFHFVAGDKEQMSNFGSQSSLIH